MLAQKRCPHDILGHMVEKCSVPIHKTELYYEMETSWGVFNQWLALALRLELIEKLRDGKPLKYRTTQKGGRFLETWEKVQTFLSEG